MARFFSFPSATSFKCDHFLLCLSLFSECRASCNHDPATVRDLGKRGSQLRRGERDRLTRNCPWTAIDTLTHLLGRHGAKVSQEVRANTSALISGTLPFTKDIFVTYYVGMPIFVIFWGGYRLLNITHFRTYGRPYYREAGNRLGRGATYIGGYICIG
jgi:hypothetical protein